MMNPKVRKEGIIVLSTGAEQHLGFLVVTSTTAKETASVVIQKTEDM